MTLFKSCLPKYNYSVLTIYWIYIFLSQAASLSFSYSVTDVTGLAVGGDWQSDDSYMKTYRTVMLIHKTKLKDIMTQMNELLGTET